MSDIHPMNRDQFLRALRSYCRKNGHAAPVTTSQGKGGHIRIQVGAASTTARSGEIGRGLHREMLSQLNVPPDAF